MVPVNISAALANLLYSPTVAQNDNEVESYDEKKKHFYFPFFVNSVFTRREKGASVINDDDDVKR